eukprot:208009-Hanusia_phi.AAC.1
MSSLQKLKNQAHEVCIFLFTRFPSRGLLLIPEQHAIARRFLEVVSTLLSASLKNACPVQV